MTTAAAIAHHRREVARLRAATPEHAELHRFKRIHRSWVRTAVGATNAHELRAEARIVRRWMRPVRRALRRAATTPQ